MIQGKDMLFSYVISVIENRDFYAEYHCEKVQRFTRILLEKVIRFCPDYKISEEDVDTICFAAMLHDVGKIVVPDRILHKAGRLDFNELEIMKNHTRKGRQIFERLMKLQEKTVRIMHCINVVQRFVCIITSAMMVMAIRWD